jgi:hypothetical protein
LRLRLRLRLLRRRGWRRGITLWRRKRLDLIHTRFLVLLSRNLLLYTSLGTLSSSVSHFSQALPEGPQNIFSNLLHFRILR